MVYKIEALDLNALLAPVAIATAALVRLDERLARSPLCVGWIERQHFADAAAALWLEGELVHAEDLVLHDAHMDIRMPTHELTRAHTVLRARRQIFGNRSDWALSAVGLAHLTRRGRSADRHVELDDVRHDVAMDSDLVPTGDETAAGGNLTKALAAMDAAIARSARVIDSGKTVSRVRDFVNAPDSEWRDETVPNSRGAEDANPQSDEARDLIYDPDWDEAARLAEWLKISAETKLLPAVLRAAILMDAWIEIDVLQHAAWLGPLLIASLLRQEGLAAHHLPSWHVGAKLIPRERRRASERTQRLIAFVDAIAAAATLGLKEHDRLAQAKTQMERRLKGKRKNSKLPDLIAFTLTRPLITAPLVEKELKISLQGALNLIGELGLREVTGRGRFRAWGVG